uniref:PTTG1 interacting protein a n=1 Tax=Scophthalmus maximus TaxID=52904 RepID=A0A8D3DPC4_SCOMX
MMDSRIVLPALLLVLGLATGFAQSPATGKACETKNGTSCEECLKNVTVSRERSPFCFRWASECVCVPGGELRQVAPPPPLHLFDWFEELTDLSTIPTLFFFLLLPLHFLLCVCPPSTVSHSCPEYLQESSFVFNMRAHYVFWSFCPSSQCLWCSKTKMCITYPVNTILPPHALCPLNEARWGLCWMNFQILIITLSVFGAILIIAFMICLFCCCKCENFGSQRFEAKMQRQGDKMKTKQEERRTEMTQRHDEIRKKYGELSHLHLFFISSLSLFFKHRCKYLHSRDT